MEKENLLYLAIFTLFFGFLVFMITIMHKAFMFEGILETYYVLFLFFAIITLIVGMILFLIWHVENKSPYIENVVVYHFPSYLLMGIVLVFAGFYSIYHYAQLNRNLYFMALSVSTVGITLLLNGLRLFLQEIIVQKKPARS